jgi:hypothetical protein
MDEVNFTAKRQKPHYLNAVLSGNSGGSALRTFLLCLTLDQMLR